MSLWLKKIPIIKFITFQVDPSRVNGVFNVARRSGEILTSGEFRQATHFPQQAKLFCRQTTSYIITPNHGFTSYPCMHIWGEGKGYYPPPPPRPNPIMIPSPIEGALDISLSSPKETSSHTLKGRHYSLFVFLRTMRNIGLARGCRKGTMVFTSKGKRYKVK